MIKFRYTGKQPILVGHKFIYQDEVHNVTAAQLAALQAQHGAALFQTDAPAVAEASPPKTPDTSDPTTSDLPTNLNNQTEKKPRKRAKAG